MVILTPGAKIKVVTAPGRAWIVGLVLSSSAMAQDAGSSSLERALEMAYEQGDIKGAASVLEPFVRSNPEDAEARAYLARIRVTTGAVAEALQHARVAVVLAPRSANAVFAYSQALWLSGDAEAALATARETLGRTDTEYGPGLRGGLTLSATALHMLGEDVAGARILLNRAYPALAGLAKRGPPATVNEIGAPWHAIQVLAQVESMAGDPAAAQALRARLRLLTEDFLRTRDGGHLSGASLWNLAATGAGRIDDRRAVRYLERAVDAGFVMDWRYNYALHPALWPLHERSDFQALLRRLERETAAARPR